MKQGVTNYSELYQLMDVTDMSLSTNQQAEKFVTSFFKILRQIGIPDEITRFGVNQEGINEFIKETMELKGALDQNPVPFYEKEIENTLRTLIGGFHD